MVNTWVTVITPPGSEKTVRMIVSRIANLFEHREFLLFCAKWFDSVMTLGKKLSVEVFRHTSSWKFRKMLLI